MNEGRDIHTDQETAEALAKALRAALDDRSAPPPVEDIARRAAERARLRSRHRAVGSIAASVVLLAGGIIVWNVVVGDASEPGTIRSEDVIVGSSVPSATTTTTEASPTGRMDAAEVSTGPALDWTEISAPVGAHGSDALSSLPDGRVLLAGSDGTRNPAVLVTADGRTWDTVPMPPGVTPIFIELGDDRWVVAGASDAGQTLHMSDDHGVSWQQLDLPDLIESEGYVRSSWSVRGAVGFGDSVVVTLAPFTTLDVRQLAVDRGLAASPQEVMSWGWNDGTGEMVITIDVGTLPSSDLAAGAPAESVPLSELVEPESVTSHQFSPAELGLPDDIDLSTGLGPVRIVVIDEDGIRSTTDLPGEPAPSPALVNVDGTLAVSTQQVAGARPSPTSGPAITTWTSTDAQTWTEVAEPGDGFTIAGATDGNLWGVGTSTFSVRRLASNRAEEVASFPNLSSPTLVVGRSGLAGTLFVSETGRYDGGVGFPETWVAWSADGESWGFQSVSETFGVAKGAEVSVQLAVGDGFVLAEVMEYPSDTARSETAESTRRWFITDVE